MTLDKHYRYEQRNGFENKNDVLFDEESGTPVSISTEWVESIKSHDASRKLQYLAVKSLISNGFKDLTKKQKQIIQLYLLGNSQKEIGRLTNTSQQNVGKTLKAIGKKLKKLIPQFEEEK